MGNTPQKRRFLAAAANVSAENFALWLKRYVYQHTRGGVVNGSVELGQNGSAPWIGENFHPDDGAGRENAFFARHIQ
jgi:hypothetical protein